MANPILNLDEAPDDPIARLLWLSGVAEQAKKELDAEFQRVYFEARLEQLLPTALSLGLHPTKRVLAWTRAENEARGRAVRWGDGY
ncbi:MAG TPA: hypothetical protein VIL10_05810 [Marmoricola sp.]